MQELSSLTLLTIKVGPLVVSMPVIA